MDVVFGITVTASSLLLGEVGLIDIRSPMGIRDRYPIGTDCMELAFASPLPRLKVDLEHGWEFTELHEVLVALAK